MLKLASIASRLVWCRRGSAAILIATTMPVMIMFVAVCVEICQLSFTQAERQRTSDVAAEAGSLT